MNMPLQFSYEEQLMNDAVGGFFGAFFTIYFALFVFCVVILWILFTKAGKPGWAAIVPFYNIIVLLEIAGKPWWWIFLCCIPIAQIVFFIIAMMNFAKAYGKSAGYGVGMFFLFPIMGAILAFNKSTKYVGLDAAPSAE